jgi:hypothetical protein
MGDLAQGHGDALRRFDAVFAGFSGHN